MWVTIKPSGHILQNPFFRVIDAFLTLWDWMICWHIFNRYLVCFENNDFKCTQCSSVDDNTNSHNFFTDITSTYKGSFLWQMDGVSILVIMYDTQACTSSTVISCMNKSLSLRLYNNRLFLSDMLGESVFSSNLWLNPQCGKWSGIDILLMMCNRFFVIFQLIIRSNVLVFLIGYFFCLRSCIPDVLVISNHCCHWDPQLSHIVVYTYSWISCFLCVISSCCHFSSISICVGLHALVFWLVVEQLRLKSLCLADRYSN